ncbi:MAG: NTP transferase domain-containing protein [Thermaurantiacus sp.]
MASAPGAGRAAIILAAGHGSRLRPVAPVKPLVEVRGRTLLMHVLDALAASGLARAIVVTGHAREAVEASLADAPLPVEPVHNPDWATSANGRSLLAARAHVVPGTLLLMGDHLVSSALVRRVIEAPDAPLVLAVDRRLGHPWVDEADVTRVRTLGTGAVRPIAAIGKTLLVYDALDTGVFRIGPALPGALAARPDPTLSEGVAMLAGRGQAMAVDTVGAPWLDVDDSRALRLAQDQWPAVDAG